MKTLKYQGMNATHIFYPIAIETVGSWDDQAVELIEEIGQRSAQEMIITYIYYALLSSVMFSNTRMNLKRVAVYD